jgi:hypothetical protein
MGITWSKELMAWIGSSSDGAAATGNLMSVSIYGTYPFRAATSGVYTPTLFNTTNVAASTAIECQWMWVGNMVQVTGSVQIDPTAASALTTLGISLPIASNLGNARQCAGTACMSTTIISPGVILGDATNNRALLQFFASTDAANRVWYFTFMYQILP